MIGAGDDDALGVDPIARELVDAVGREELVVRSGGDALRARVEADLRLDGRERGRDEEPAVDAVVDQRGDTPTEGVADDERRQAVGRRTGDNVNCLRDGDGEVGGCEVESVRDHAGRRQAAVERVDDVVVPVAAHVGVGVQQHGGRERFAVRSGLVVVGHGATVPLEAMAKPAKSASADSDKLPIQMLNDRVLVKLGEAEGERRSTGGILIPATAQMSKRLAWAEVVGAGPNVRSLEIGDQVLFNPEDRYEVEVRGDDYIILRERDVHAVAAKRLEEGSTGLYL